MNKHKNAMQKAEKDKKTDNVQTDVQMDKKGQSTGQKNGQQKRTAFLREIDLTGEFKSMAETVNPKKEEKKYKCGACGGEFGEKHKRCPHCGVEFE